VRRFVNTNDEEGGNERFADPAALRAWLTEAGLLDPSAPVGDAGLARALELREAVRCLLLAHNGLDGGDDHATDKVNRAAARARLRPVLGEDGTIRLVPESTGLDAALGRIVGAIHAGVAEGTWPRLKACERDSCRWAFYDHSKNRAGRWCTMEVCGNREKSLRAYRRRQKSPVSPSRAKTA
jgi:predicted RNA-binding Zn ribbon-like protein